jgi:peptidylprolyl isomerase
VIELAPDFAPQHVANITTLAKEHYWDGLFVIRSQDNYVAQWGDPAEEDAKKKSIGTAKKHLPAEFERKARRPALRAPARQRWLGAGSRFSPAASPSRRDPKADTRWLAHCYGMVGAGRDVAADSSDGTSLYAVTGQSPRMLDRNITLVGRVVQGIELLSVLPRGTGALGFYEKPEQYVTITSARMASDVPEAERTRLELLRTDSKTFATVVESRRNRRDEWYKRPAGHIDLCNVPLPVRSRNSTHHARLAFASLASFDPPPHESPAMPTLRLRVTGSDDDARAIINLLQSLDGNRSTSRRSRTSCRTWTMRIRVRPG